MYKLAVEDLLTNSKVYDSIHKLNQIDFRKASDLHRRIIKSRRADKPMPGDIMLCKGRAREYDSGHIEYENLSKIDSICVQPSIPFITNFCCRRDEFSLSTSGGYWFSIAKKKLYRITYIGTREKLFKAWGHCGPCAEGAFTFSCEVNVWEYNSNDIY